MLIYKLSQSTISPVDLKVLLPDREIVTVSTLKNSNADQVYDSVVQKIRMPKNTSLYFYLFEIVEYNFGKHAKIVLFSNK